MPAGHRPKATRIRCSKRRRRQVGPGQDGKAIAVPFTVSYKPEDAVTGKPGDAKDPQTFNFHPTPVGARTAWVQLHLHPGLHRDSHPGRVRVGDRDGRRGEEPQAGHPARGVAVAGDSRRGSATCSSISPRTTSSTTATRCPNAGASGAPLGDMMVIVGTWLFGSYAAGKAFMLVQAVHRVPRADRHHAVLPQHRRPRDLRDGPRRGSAVALRPGARHGRSRPTGRSGRWRSSRSSSASSR